MTDEGRGGGAELDGAEADVGGGEDCLWRGGGAGEKKLEASALLAALELLDAAAGVARQEEEATEAADALAVCWLVCGAAGALRAAGRDMAMCRRARCVRSVLLM